VRKRGLEPRLGFQDRSDYQNLPELTISTGNKTETLSWQLLEGFSHTDSHTELCCCYLKAQDSSAAAGLESEGRRGGGEKNLGSLSAAFKAVDVRCLRERTSIVAAAARTAAAG